MPRSALGEPIVLLSGALCVFGAALLAVGGQQAADNDARALVVKALERVTWNEEQDFAARYRSLMTREVRRYDGDGRVDALVASDGTRITAGTYVFACGPWLPKLFPAVLGDRIRPTRQEVFFFGSQPGDRRFAPPAMPAWVDFAGGVYGLPDLGDSQHNVISVLEKNFI